MEKKKKKTIKRIVLITLAVVLLVSILLPVFKRKSGDGDVQTVNFAEDFVPYSYLNSGEERVICIDDNLDALTWRLKVINSAKDNLDFATFSFTDDRSGRSIMSALYNAAERGVKVRIAIDGLSGFLYLKRSRYFNSLASSENVEIKFYNPIKLYKPWRFNYRMHDKYIISDNNIYMLGGRNTKNLSIGNYDEKQDIDRDVIVFCDDVKSGNSIFQLKEYFENIWNDKYSKSYSVKGKVDEKTISNLNAYYKNLMEDFPDSFKEINWYEETIPVKGVQLLSNPVNNGNKVPVLWNSLMRLGKTGKEIIIQTPYIMCNRKMYRDLTELNEDGRKVKIVTNSVENGANIFGCADYLNQKKKVLKTGSDVYECNGDHSFHAKTMLIDNNISIVGSFNCDMRSAYIDTELMLVIDSPELNSYLRGMMQKNMDQGRCVSPDGSVTYGPDYVEKELSSGRKFLYRICRILSAPIRFLL